MYNVKSELCFAAQEMELPCTCLTSDKTVFVIKKIPTSRLPKKKSECNRTNGILDDNLLSTSSITDSVPIIVHGVDTNV